MANTLNVNVGPDWVAVAGEGDLLLTGEDSIDDVRFAIRTDGVPAADLIGHVLPRADNYSMTLEASEVLYLRRTGEWTHAVVLTTDNPDAGIT